MTPPEASTVRPDGMMHRSLRVRPALDVSKYPDIAFGHHDIVWWGTLGFMVIEGFTLALCLVVYLYLWKNFATWPPAGTEAPTLLVPTVNLGVMLASLPLMNWIARAAQRFELRKVRLGLAAGSVIIVLMSVLRVFEFQALHVRWNTNAYGSAQWLVVGMHGTLILIEAVEVIGIAAIFWFGATEEKHFSDVADVALYWKFLVSAWVPVYVLCFLGPRWFM
jgi:heme/copper-type cytochrome/quinol oxidase subunit 3